MIRASIIVCTRNRSEMLVGCLESIYADSSTVDREIVVVDNGSTDDTAAVVRRAIAASSIPMRYILEPRSGLSRARNAGLAQALGAILLFTDDDVLVRPGWADALVRPFDDDSVGGAGGRITPEWLEEPPAWMHGAHSVILTLPDRGLESRPLRNDEDPTGANMAIRASALTGLHGKFDAEVGHRGTLNLGYEEVQLFHAIRRDSAIRYVADAVVVHRILGARATWEKMRLRHFQDGFGYARACRNRSPEGNVLSLRTCARLLKLSVRVLRRRAETISYGRTGKVAQREFAAYFDLGEGLDTLLQRHPVLSDWCARHLGSR